MTDWQIRQGDVREVLAGMDDQSVHCVVTSPPYWGLRDYGLPPLLWGGSDECEHDFALQESTHTRSDPGGAGMNRARGFDELRQVQHGFCRLCGCWRGSLGLEPTPSLYIEHLVGIFRQVRRVLRDDGTLWCNIAGSYASGKGTCFNPGGGADSLEDNRKEQGAYPLDRGNVSILRASGLKPKDWVPIPWMLGMALQRDGWYLRSPIIWAKGLSFCETYSGSVMPESVRDRPTTSYEYVLLLTKNKTYYYDADAVREATSPKTHSRGTQWRDLAYKMQPVGQRNRNNPSFQSYMADLPPDHKRNLRSVWAINPSPFSDWGYDFRNADYVDENGIPHIRSEDCPIHGRGARRQQEVRAVTDDDAPAVSVVPRISGTDDHPAQEPSAFDVPKESCSTKQAEDSQLVQPQESIHGSKIVGCLDVGAYRKHRHNSDIQSLCVLSKQDSLHPSSAHSAIEHSNQTSKIDHVPLSVSHDSASEEQSHHIEYTSPPLFGFEPCQRIAESNTLVDDHEHEQGKDVLQTASHNKHKHPLSSSVTSNKEYKCLCRISQVSHFATFPPALVEPCIKAGTSERGCCPECGAPHERVVEKETTLESGWGRQGLKASDVKDRGKRLEFGRAEHDIRLGPTVKTATIGWRPGCSCYRTKNKRKRERQDRVWVLLTICWELLQDDEVSGEDKAWARERVRLLYPWSWQHRVLQSKGPTIPCIALDPFVGSGTTVMVALRLGRRAVGIDLSEEYCRMAWQRVRNDNPMFNIPGEAT